MRIFRLRFHFKRILLEIILVYLFITIVIKTHSVYKEQNWSTTTTALSGLLPGLLHVYDLTKNSTDQSKCVPVKIPSKPKICIHDVLKDRYVSGELKSLGVWEPDMMKLFQNTLASDKHLDVIDIGANLGLYSLIGAAMGRKVLAAEPFDVNIGPFHKTVQLNGFQNNIHLITNAIGNKREKVFFKTYAENAGGTSMWEGREACIKKKCPSAMSTYMDDLVPLIKEMNMTKVILKLDIEGAEHLALAEAAAVFKLLDIRFIFMEIIIQTGFCDENITDSEDKRLVVKMFDFLVKEGFTRVFPAGAQRPTIRKKKNVKVKQELRQKGSLVLDPRHCSPEWPRNVLWVHESQKYPF